MSYGVWKKHGKGWSSIEIDGMQQDDPYLLRWTASQKKKGFSLYQLVTNSDHCQFFAVPKSAGDFEIAAALQKMNCSGYEFFKLS